MGKGHLPCFLQINLKPQFIELGGGGWGHIPVGPLLVQPVGEPDLDPAC